MLDAINNANKALATHGKASDTTEPEATCHTCGNELELVRPGKHQCHYCDENADVEPPRK